MTDCSEEWPIKCCCCGVFLQEGKEYFALDEEGEEMKDHPLCCECSA